MGASGMTVFAFGQIALYLVVLAVLALPLGAYIHRVMEGVATPLSGLFRPVECALYRACGIALLPYVKLPTAQSGLGNGRVEGGMILPLSFSAPDSFTVIVMPEGDYLKDSADSGYHGAVEFLVNVSHPLDQRWTWYSELFTSHSFQVRDRPLYTLDGALTCALKPSVQLDFGGNFSLNGVGPRAQLYAGLSQRF
jgi:hypothetical protein